MAVGCGAPSEDGSAGYATGAATEAAPATIAFDVKDQTSSFYVLPANATEWRIVGGPFSELLAVNLEGNGVGTVERHVGTAIPSSYEPIPTGVTQVHFFNRTGSTVKGTVEVTQP